MRVGEDGRVHVLSLHVVPQPLKLAPSPSRARNRLEVPGTGRVGF